MFSLTIAIFSSASLALIFRHTENQDYDRYAVTMTNYAAALLFALVLWISGGGELPSPVSIAVGIPGGALFFAGFIVYQLSVRRYGAGPAGMYGKLGVLVPMTLSVLVWHEIPGILQIVGAALALLAILVSQIGRLPKSTRPGSGTGAAAAAGGAQALAAGESSGAHGSSDARAIAGPAGHPLLILQLLVMGFAEFSNKVFEYYGTLPQRPVFLTILFGTALVLSAAVLWGRRHSPRPREVLWGIAIGIPNLFSSYFLIAALETVPAATAFPVFSAGSTTVIALGALVIYRESPRPLQWVAFALTIVALVLVS